ncbi:hypothetical protein Ferp_0336 [Ferroglobus placidus DSM 10642]|uniref:Uncharacterized protein n=1 Tax=Ferroglobus placidus (strain DSM 10642 / AEDII12DO) TaxID=589924 RepID=D3S2I5_FERPA|nr:hypothetical protein [Ferroglobus placidus]ADC64515.1 hypothetical protein Ferp_0336 [Ferroglobus placidus DSM 10642]
MNVKTATMIFFVFLLIAALFFRTHSVKNGNEFRPLTEEEIKKLVEGRKLDVIAVKDIGNQTVVLYRTSGGGGYLILSVSSGRLVESEATWTSSGNVSVSTHRTGTPFIALILNNSGFREVIVKCGNFSKTYNVTEVGLIIPVDLNARLCELSPLQRDGRILVYRLS